MMLAILRLVGAPQGGAGTELLHSVRKNSNFFNVFLMCLKYSCGVVNLTGKYGEDLAQKYLIAAGYEILAQNYHSRFGEIDLIAEADGRVTFFEVKTRKGKGFGLPEEAVDRLKIMKILKTAREFLEKNNLRRRFQIDVISIQLNMYNMVNDLTHIKNVFQ